MTYVSAAEKAKIIRDELKAKGITPKQVSVRSRPCGYSDSIDIHIKDLTVDMKLVEKIADKQAYQRYDCRGEILEGCNTYVFVGFDYTVVSEHSKKLLDISEQILDTAKAKCSITEGIDIYNDGTTQLVLFPHSDQIMPHVSIMKNYRSVGYGLEARRDAHNKYSLAEAIVLFCFQNKLDICKVGIA